MSSSLVTLKPSNWEKCGEDEASEIFCTCFCNKGELGKTWLLLKCKGLSEADNHRQGKHRQLPHHYNSKQSSLSSSLTHCHWDSSLTCTGERNHLRLTLQFSSIQGAVLLNTGCCAAQYRLQFSSIQAPVQLNTGCCAAQSTPVQYSVLLCQLQCTM